MTIKKTIIILFALVLSLEVSAKLNSKKVDSLLNEIFDKEGPGGAALIVKEGKTIYRKAFGMANLEFDIKMTPDNIFQIGSITKQFTAVAILQLVEQGKMNLDDDITKYIEDYPTHGHNITIEHLLTHTSGIKEFSKIEGRSPNVGRIDHTPEELINLFKNKPMDFKPGEKFQYNNSAYMLLGHIIEKVSGQPYPQYIQDNLLKPLNMDHSSYGSVTEIIPRKASGYSKNDEGYIKAGYLSMSYAYSAGAIFSTVEDLSKWYYALTSGQVISESSIKKATTPYTLNNGEQTDYGYGLKLHNVQGSPMITHGGNMPGYFVWSTYFLNENIFVAIFTNCDCDLTYDVSYKIAAIAVDKPFEWQEIKLDEELLLSYDGLYESEKHGKKVISYTNGLFKFYDPAWRKYTMYPFAKDKFFFNDGDFRFSTLNIERDSNDKITSIQLLGEDYTKTWQKTDKPFKKYPVIAVDPKTFADYLGKYELFPGFFLEIITENNTLYVAQEGKNKAKLTPFAEHQFDSESLDAQFTFNFDENNKVTGFTLHQGKKHEAKKVE
jgi:CubicO group peptidase (beta-lactamase class C family)